MLFEQTNINSMTRHNTFLSFLFFFLLSPTLWAQTNDECAGATVIADPSDFCTAAPGEDNTTASPSAQAFPSCWTNVGADLWYSFTAVATDMVVIVKGATPSFPTGTMQGPLVAVYSGDCNNLLELGCAIGFSNNMFINNLPLTVSDLVVGQQYFIRIDGITPGLFELCIKNQENVNVASGDCPTATLVTCTAPIVTDQVFGPGNDPNELGDAPCLTGFAGESSAAWYVFTAVNAAKLTFTITPNDPNDDIDFVLYRLPNGPNDCTGKVSERCMVAGDFGAGSPCMGPTGLNLTATDINQPPGCAAGSDNFLRFLTLVPGRTYALCINNFTTVGNGFTLEWGQEPIFQGAPTANFSSDQADIKLCQGEEVVLTDSSYTAGGVISEWNWAFGEGSVSDSTTGQGPHTIQYQTLGPKQIILTIKNDAGCEARDTANFVVQVCCILEAEVSVEPGCPEPNDTEALAIVDVKNGLDPLTITWSNGQTGSNDTTSIDSSGTYTVLVVDANGCKDSVSFSVNTPLNLSAMFPPDTTILEGATISLAISAMPNDSLSVTWTDGDGNILTGPSITITPEDSITYFVVVNNTGCIFSDSVTVIVEKPQYKNPNAFTPNGDGSNDTFGPVLKGHSFVQLEVWSRWGDKVFDSTYEGKNTWDGTINGEEASSDVYVYRVRVRLVNGEEKIDKGHVTLLR